MKYLGEYNSTFVQYEDKHAFVESATFADDFKYHGEMWQSDFHFFKNPWIEEEKESDYDVDLREKNLTIALNDITAWLSGKKGTTYKSHYLYTFLMKKFDNDENVAKSYALRLLIHYMGDLLQPFHCETRYNKEFSDGDKGANAFPLKNHYGVDELHALWDRILYDGKDNIDRPFTDDTWDAFQVSFNQVMSNYSYAVDGVSVYKSTNFDKWAGESYDIAIQLYEGLTESAAVPQDYLDKWHPTAYERLIIGGYRLYYVIDYIFKDQNEVQSDGDMIDEDWFDKWVS